ncbi:hypothetical protein JXL21_05370 [Candidatus Bathyarchaeota archaeon]|nr:hypothetical protein [Candidatus Bathyarchaeota archaeon]
MKKVTIITPPEYEGLVLESLGRAQVTQLTPVTGAEYEGLRGAPEEQVDYRELYQRIQARFVEPLGEMKVERVTPSVDELRSFSLDPVGKVESIIKDASVFIDKIEASEEDVHVRNNRVVEELQKKLALEKANLEDAKAELAKQLETIDEEKVKYRDQRVALKARLESVQALEPEELKNCFAVGVAKTEFIPKMVEYLKRYPETYHRTAKISEEESFIFVFGSEESRKWVDALFLIYDIKDIFDVLESGDLLLVLDPSKRKEAIEKYRAQIAEMEKSKKAVEDENPEEKKVWTRLEELEGEYEANVAALKEEYDGKIKENEESHRQEIAKFKEEQAESLGVVAFYVNLLRTFSRKNAPVLRGKVISVLQGYTPESQIPVMQTAIRDVEKSIGETLFVEVSDLGHDDKHAPTPALEMPSFLGPTWILTRLRGWPSAEELNPGYISVLVFCFQFGLMFGDIGQGLIYLAIGLALRSRFEKGMMKYLTNLFIPMGIAAILFGFMYDSFFLIEHGITHWLHGAHISLPFNYPIMPNPVHQMGELMNLIFMVGAIEIVLGSLLGAFNAFKEGNYVGMIGEHGFGMGLYVTGLYLSAGALFTEGLDIMMMVGNWPFMLMLAGMALSFMEPVLHSVQHGHGVSVESLGEGLGGLLMTFVEGLANMFSFLRIAAFALAHASLAGAGEALGQAIGSGILGLLIMNVIALSFEFVSSSVQSLRLLYYEFMGKFYHGSGVPFKPFRINKS